MKFGGKLKRKIIDSIGMSIIDLNGHIKQRLIGSDSTSRLQRLLKGVDYLGGHKVYERLTDEGKEKVFKIIDDETINKFDLDHKVGLVEMKEIARNIEKRLNVEVSLKQYGKDYNAI